MDTLPFVNTWGMLKDEGVWTIWTYYKDKINIIVVSTLRNLFVPPKITRYKEFYNQFQFINTFRIRESFTRGSIFLAHTHPPQKRIEILKNISESFWSFFMKSILVARSNQVLVFAMESLIISALGYAWDSGRIG